MPNFKTNVEIPQDKEQAIEALTKRQGELEEEIQDLRKMFKEMNRENSEEIGKINYRIDEVEKEVAAISEALQKLQTTVNSIKDDISTVNQSVGQVNAKQDVALEAQDKFIYQLWRAFFALLGVITLIGGGIVALFK